VSEAAGEGRAAGPAPLPAPRPGERRRLVLSFGYFALLLASYYMIRPLRDAFGAGSGATTIKHLAAAVFLLMLLIVPVFGWLIARVPRARLLPLTYGFFVLNLAGFGAVFATDPENLWVGRAFYVWATVFNMFVVSVFWSFMAEIWREAEGRRLFGVIAAGGSLGGLLGPLLTRALAGAVGTAGVVFGAAALLACSVGAIVLLSRDALAAPPAAGARLDEPVGGSILAGLSRLAGSPFLLGIAALVAFGSLLGMMVYIEMARVAGSLYATSAARAAFFAGRDLWVNGASFALQLGVGVLTATVGVRAALTGAAAVLGAGFVALTAAPVAGVLIAVNVLTRALEFGVAKPSRDMLYTVVDPETKYKVKNVIDTVLYRATDVASGWLHDGLVAAGATLAALAGFSVAIAAALTGIAWVVGSGYRRRGGR
jgi:ATP:ADP antiporter, AAA family